MKLPDETTLIPNDDADDEAELISKWFAVKESRIHILSANSLKRRRQKTQRLYILVEITPTILILGSFVRLYSNYLTDII